MIVTFLKITRNTASDSFKNLPVRKYLNRIFYLLLGVLTLVQSNPCYILDSIRYSNTFTHMEDLFKGNNTHAFSLRSEHTLFSAVCYICVKVKALSEPSNYFFSVSSKLFKGVVSTSFLHFLCTDSLYNPGKADFLPHNSTKTAFSEVSDIDCQGKSNSSFSVLIIWR